MPDLQGVQPSPLDGRRANLEYSHLVSLGLQPAKFLPSGSGKTDSASSHMGLCAGKIGHVVFLVSLPLLDDNAWAGNYL